LIELARAARPASILIQGKNARIEVIE